MAIFKVEVEIDWLEEGESLDQVIQETAIRQITDSVSKQLIEKNMQQMSQEISGRVDKLVNETFHQFMNREVVQTNDYGEETRTFPSVREMLKSKLDNYMIELVDKNGKTRNQSGGYGWSSFGTRFEYIFKNQVEAVMQKKLSELSKEVNNRISEIENTLIEQVRASFGAAMEEKISKLLEIDKLLPARK